MPEIPRPTTGLLVPTRLVAQTTQIVTTVPRAFLRVGQTSKLNPILTDEDGNVLSASFDFASADESIATVDSTGLISAVAVGTTTVTVTDASLTLTATVTIADTSVLFTATTPWSAPAGYYYVSKNPYASGGQS